MADDEIRGAESDIPDAETAADMATREGLELVTLPGLGHAPAPMDPAQIALVAGSPDRARGARG